MTDDEWEDDDEKTALLAKAAQESTTSADHYKVKGVTETTQLKGSK